MILNSLSLAVTPMTMGDDLLFCLLDAARKVPFIPAVGNKRSVGERSNRNQGSVWCRANSWGMFSVWGTGSQAVLSFFLRSFGHASQGLQAGSTFLSVRGLCYLSGRLSDSWEGAGLLPLSTVTSLFLPLSTVTSRFLPLSSLASHFFLLPGLTPATMG